MSDLIKILFDKATETYTYTDCDGCNNRGRRLNELTFAKLIIDECVKVNKQFPDYKIGELNFEAFYKEHFKLK